jgi:Mce-associated membrane protein
MPAPRRRVITRRVIVKPVPEPARKPWTSVALLAAAAVVLGGLSVWFAREAGRLRSTAGAANTALTDSAATSAVNGQVTTAVNTLFSYDYRTLDKTQQAARTLLTGKAVCQYDKLFTVIREQAPQQRLVVTVTVTNSGVELLTGDRARVLVFATQSDTSTASKKTATAGAMFAVDAVRSDDTWQVDNIDTFTGDPQPATCG